MRNQLQQEQAEVAKRDAQIEEAESHIEALNATVRRRLALRAQEQRSRCRRKRLSGVFFFAGPPFRLRPKRQS